MAEFSRERYGANVNWKSFLQHYESVEEIPDGATILRFRRRGESHRGISRFRSLGSLLAFCVDQNFLEELVRLPALTTLCIEELTATDLHVLSKCTTLRRLIINGGTKVPSLDWVSELPKLEVFLIQNFKLVKDIGPLASLDSVLALGIEGSMWTTQSVDTLEPLEGMAQLKALFLTNCRVATGGLRPLHHLKSLEYLESASLPGDAEFRALHRALPLLRCQWIEAIEKYGSIRDAMKAFKARIKRS